VGEQLSTGHAEHGVQEIKSGESQFYRLTFSRKCCIIESERNTKRGDFYGSRTNRSGA